MIVFRKINKWWFKENWWYIGVYRGKNWLILLIERNFMNFCGVEKRGDGL